MPRVAVFSWFDAHGKARFVAAIAGEVIKPSSVDRDLRLWSIYESAESAVVAKARALVDAKAKRRRLRTEMDRSIRTGRNRSVVKALRRARARACKKEESNG